MNIPTNYSVDPSLGSWVHRQRHLYRNKKLKKFHTEKLNQIDFDWRLLDGKLSTKYIPWMVMYQRLIEYNKEEAITTPRPTLREGRFRTL
mmetsp:Transcript_10345/g.11803  ORF Transcript_10345/g.11803 Transcript_10345/m.11803 type:complete len:90 (-) Transcript_10345:146-415(-)